MTSLDDSLRISCFNYEKFAYNEFMGQVEVPLNFLEYYGEKNTEQITLDLEGDKGKIIVQMNYKIA